MANSNEELRNKNADQATKPDGENEGKPVDKPKPDKPKKNIFVRVLCAVGRGVKNLGKAVVEGVEEYPKTAIGVLLLGGTATGWVLHECKNKFFGPRYTQPIPVETNFVDRDEELETSFEPENLIPEAEMDIPETTEDNE